MAVTIDVEQGEATCVEGDVLAVSLPGLGTTGLRWTVLAEGGVLLPEAGRSSHTEEAVGGMGRDVLSFDLIRAGTALLVFEAREPWGAPTDPPDASRSFRVVVHPAAAQGARGLVGLDGS